ncbi:tetraspanin-18-like [Styela clava]
MKSASMTCLKYLMFFFNLLFFICGAAVLGVGIWALVNEKTFKEMMANNPMIFNGIYIIIGVGAALLVIGFMGCCGAIKENRCLLITFFVLVLLVLIVEIAAAILIYAEKGKIEKSSLSSMTHYGSTDAQGKLVTQGWDTIQATIGCCGFNSYKDWKTNGYSVSGKIVPDSCCKHKLLKKDSPILNVTLCQKADVKYLNAEGCASTLEHSKLIVGAVALGVLVFEILAMIFSCCLYKSLGTYKRVA